METATDSRCRLATLLHASHTSRTRRVGTATVATLLSRSCRARNLPKLGAPSMISYRALRCAFVLLLASLLGTCGKADTTSGPPSVAAQLGFKVSAGSTTAGGIITPAVVVEARDANGKLVPSFSDPITVSLVRNPGNGTLSGTTTVTAVGGVATFANLSIDKSGSGYRLQATSGTLSSGSGSRFDIIAAAPTHLAFAVAPGTGSAGTPMAPAVQVTAQDSLGNVATSFTGLITVAI